MTLHGFSLNRKGQEFGRGKEMILINLRISICIEYVCMYLLYLSYYIHNSILDLHLTESKLIKTNNLVVTQYKDLVSQVVNTGSSHVIFLLH